MANTGLYFTDTRLWSTKYC